MIQFEVGRETSFYFQEDIRPFSSLRPVCGSVKYNWICLVGCWILKCLVNLKLHRSEIMLSWATIEVTSILKSLCTFMTEGSGVGWLATVAGETIGSLHTVTLVLAERAVAAAVARASRSDPWGDLCPLLQVQSDAVQLQRADAAQKTFLSGRSASCKQKQMPHTRYISTCVFFLTWVAPNLADTKSPNQSLKSPQSSSVQEQHESAVTIIKNNLHKVF